MTSIYTNNSYNNYNNFNNNITPSLNQGDLFKNYQNKIKTKNKYSNDKYSDDNNFMEGFDTNTNTNSITEQSQSLLKQTEEIKANKKNVSELKKNYKSSLTQYDDLTNTRSKQTQDYYDRIDPVKNPYLNQNICLTNGSCGYVTNQGVFKPYPSDNDVTYNNTAGKNGCPSTAYVKVDGEGDINAIGSMTTTTPSLLIGTSMVSGQSCGYEGNNIYVDKMLPPDMTANYLDVYGTRGNSNIKFIGEAPAPEPIGFNGIQNGRFAEPRIKDNSYEYINSTSRVPGWEFKGRDSGSRGTSGAVLINLSKAWNYPIPYGHGIQAACIQGNSSIIQSLYMPVGTYTLTFYAVKRPSSGSDIDVQLNDKSIFAFTATGSWTKYSVPINITKNDNYRIKFQGNSSTQTAIQDVKLDVGTITKTDTALGTYTYDMCKESAMMNGYQYFGLQDVNTEKSKGYCAVTNDYISLTAKGQDRVIQATIILWESKTAGEGVSASLNYQGGLDVYDSSGKTLFTTPNDKAIPGDYFGCYNNKKKGKKKKNKDECEKFAKKKGAGYYGIRGNRCKIENNITAFTNKGKAGNCKKEGDVYMGGNKSYAVYGTQDGVAVYCLEINNDGNMTLRRGFSPGDNQGDIWETGTQGKVQDANPMYTAAKGKFGAPWIRSGKTLVRGEFIGSIDGKCALVMQNDGNLVLCTWQMGPNEVSMSDGNNGGGQGAAGFFDLSQVGIRKNFGKVGFVDENAALHEYPETNLKFTTNYTKYSDVNCPGSDIPNAAYDNSTVEKCETTCNSMENCAGFIFQKDISRCWPKDKGIYPNSDIYNSSRDDTYLRTKEPVKLPNGIESTTLIGTDSILYNGYVNGGGFDQKFGLPKALENIQQKVKTKGKQLNTYGSKVQDMTSIFSKFNNKLTEQSSINLTESDAQLDELDKTKDLIANMDNGIDNILNDTDIMVLQKNYSYLFWSIIAIGTVIVSMNIIKKK